MTQQRTSYHHGALREALVEAAIALVREVGAESFSLRDAAKRVGVTPSATYRHFENKSALLSAVAEASVGKLGQRMRRALAQARRACASAPSTPQQSAIALFKEVGRVYVAFASEQTELFRVMCSPHGKCRLDQPPDPHHPGPEAVLAEILDDLVRAHLLPPERRPGAEFRAWTILHGFAMIVIDGSPILPTAARCAEALEEILDFALDGLCGRSLKAP